MNILHIEKSYWQQDIRIRQYGMALGLGIVLAGLVAWLFYQSFLAFGLLLLVLPFWIVYWRKGELARRKENFRQQFQEVMYHLRTDLEAGYAIENALRETRLDMERLYPQRTALNRELAYMDRQLGMNFPAEQVFMELAERTEIEEVRQFATIFQAAKRGGGDLIGILQYGIAQIGEKTETKKEIQTLLTGRQYEFRVMSLIPFGILLYMKTAFGEFMAILYGNVLGVLLMTVCLGVYGVAYWWGKKIVEIEV